MNHISREWLVFLREQYPAGSRVKLREMKDPYHPVEPGTMGTLDYIDYAGGFHTKLDNGRTLALIIGQDSFTVLPPEPKLLKLYMPMTVGYFERDDYGDQMDEETTMGDREAAGYADTIAGALRREERPEEAARGLMAYYGKDDSVDRKVLSYRITAEARNGRLWGVAECLVLGELTADELRLLIDDVTGQAADGLGEGFEQRPIHVDGRELYAHLWQWDDSWSVQTEEALFAPKLAEELPELCFSTLLTTGDLICIKRGETGYYPSDWDTHDKDRNVELADELNEEMGVTMWQRKAMEVGSMCGWDVPGADPANYQKPFSPQMGGLGRG